MGEMRYEREIRLKDFVYEITRRWKAFLLVMAVGALLFPCAKYSESLKLSEIESEEKKLIELSELEEAEINDALNMQKQIVEMREYVKSSLYMDIDPLNEKCIQLNYYLKYDSLNENSSYGKDLISLYTNYISSGLYVGEVEKNDIDAKDIRELVSAGSNMGEDGKGRMFYVEVIGKDEMQCQEIADIIKQVLASYRNSVVDKFGAHELVLVSESIFETRDFKTMDEQNAHLVRLQRLEQNIAQLEDTFNDNQKQVYEQKCLEDYKNLEDFTDQTSIAVKPASYGINDGIKDFVLGSIMGFILMCVYSIVTFVLSDRVLSGKEVSNMFQLRNIGELDRQVSVKNAEIYEKQMQDIQDKIVVSCMIEKVDRIYLAVEQKEDSDSSMIVDLVRRLKEKNIVALKGGLVSDSVDSLRDALKMQGIILVETVKKSKMDTLAKELDVCKQNYLKVLGNISIK